jgi:hypothetical protein
MALLILALLLLAYSACNSNNTIPADEEPAIEANTA